MDSRHHSTESFERYLGSHVPVDLPIHGTPTTSVFIRPSKPELGVRIEIDPSAYIPDTGLNNIVTRPAVHRGRPHLEVVVVETSLFRAAYPVLCSTADRVQLDGMEPAAALRETLSDLTSLLREAESISMEREIGLMGELLTLRGLIASLGGPAAVEAWRGPNGEEHDFGLPDADVEVKTTISERRAHWIESFTQLQPSAGRPLWLLSHQLTGTGTEFGWTLAELIDEVASTLTGRTHDEYRVKVSKTGWREAHALRIRSRWERRQESAAFEVTSRFPRLAPEALQRAGFAVDRFIQVRYRIDLDGIASPDVIPAAIIAALGS
ncbi:PD-(D/E)XK motif protein [Actinoplanes sp. NPDC051494]|uniref:PD-(D/E)XK motif protein n=1 Tax=Actinoplanes sp. NPDC051494 TaxID=3363907 RepID=UPI00379386A6